MESTEIEALPTARETALHLLVRIEDDGAFADRILASSRVTRYDTRDRAFIRELVLGIQRWKLKLDYIINYYYMKNLKKLDSEVLSIIRLGLYQLIYVNSVPDRAAVYESVQLATETNGKGAGGLVNAILRNFTREGEPALPDDKVKKMSVEFSYPVWLIERWIKRFGFKTAKLICVAGNERHPVQIRARKGKIETSQLASQLAEVGFDTDSVPDRAGYLVVQKGEGLFDTYAFSKGLFTVQDPAAGMAVQLLAPEPGDRVLDVCSAPGGKTTQIAELMNDSGSVTAVDIHSGRLDLVKKSAERLGLMSIEYIVCDAREFGIGDDALYDRILVDVPCSGTAVLSKRPDMKWRLTPKDTLQLQELQFEILENSSRLVKPGGALVYSTCTLEVGENEGIVSRFLDSHRQEYTLVKSEKFKDFELERKPGYSILPHKMFGAGAYAVKLVRNHKV